MRHGTAVVLTALSGIAATALTVMSPTPAGAVQAAQPTMVNPVPSTASPDVRDGAVLAIGRVGANTYIGGSFTRISNHASATIVTANHIAAFNATTGLLQAGFAPAINGQVNTIAAGPTAGTVYVGGDFTTVNGVATHVALLNATTGAIAPGWSAPALNGNVDKLVLATGQLFVGGSFTTAGAAARRGLAALNPTTGALSTYATPNFTGHHNYGRLCDPGTATCAQGGVGIKALDVNPAGTQMVAIGNFTDVAGSPRDQVARLNLSGTAATVDPGWSTLAYSAACFANRFDYYVRDVQYSTDGAYFVIVSTGRGGTNSDGTQASCDTVDRFSSSATGTNVQPTWLDFTGSDSLFSVAITGTAVYVGGHPRWMNDTFGVDNAAAGAVPRPGLAALDPQNGLPLAWNPGRNPRGAGAMALLATPDGLYVGSDTDYIGNHAYQRDKIAYFPLAGGTALASNATGSLPGDVYLVGGASTPTSARSIHWDGTSAPGAPQSVAAAALNPSTLRGAFDVNHTVFYGSTDGNFYRVSFDGTTFGTPTAVDPYNDPIWSNVTTGSNNTTYRGLKSNFYAELGSLTSIVYDRGRIYYTRSGQSRMNWRWFEPDDGIVGADEFVTTDSIDWSHVAGAFRSGGTLYYATDTTGALNAVAFGAGGAVGTPSVVDTTRNWASYGDFMESGQGTGNQPPTAAFTVTCTGLTCAVNGHGSSDPDGTIASYSWSWGDGTTSQDTTGNNQHTYAGGGSDTITLTVTDNGGLTGSTSHGVTVGGIANPIKFGGIASTYGNAATETVSVPAPTQVGDALLLFDSFAATTATASVPAGWTLVGSAVRGSQTTQVYSRVATAADLGRAVTVNYSAVVKAVIAVADYSGTDGAAPVETSASATAQAVMATVAPALNGLSAGTYVVSYWADKSSATTSFTPPGAVTQRLVRLGTGTNTINALIGDSAGAVGSSYPAQTATTNDASKSSVGWSVALAPGT